MQLEELRNKIDALDDNILQLLNERMEHVKSIGKIKADNKTAVYRPEREQKIIDRLTGKSQGLLKRSAIEAIFLEIFAVSRNLELPEKIAYLGPVGSFTHQAAESRYGAMSEYVPLGSINAVFETINTERAKFGVVPIENNQEGVVQETIDLLGEYDLNIVAEIPMPIHFAFASLSDSIRDIKKIYSKDIAFRQCKKFISDLFADNVKLIPVNSTSKACELALKEQDSAAIAAHIAAQLNRLPILFDNIEDSDQNHTRFLILSKDFKNQISGTDKTSILARLPDKPGALADFLEQFHKYGINLCKVESRPAKMGTDFKYKFYIDFDDHFDNEKVQKAIGPYLESVKWLGSYLKLC